MQNRRALTASIFPLALALLFAAWHQAARAQSKADETPFRIADGQLSSPPVVISYGDVRFTDPSEIIATNPKVRRWLVDRIAAEKPDALLIGGDLPYHGGVANDYAVFENETASWRAANLFLIPVLGNHEMYGQNLEQCVTTPEACLENWWRAFPKLRGRRWYSVEIGSRMVVLNLDSTSSLMPGGGQAQWIQEQLAELPSSVRFVFINLHHPPVANPLAGLDADHSGRPNERALAEYLQSSPLRKRLRFIVIGAHIHNYQRFLRDGVVYLVSGGGGAQPYSINRGPDDLYRDKSEPNYHYLKFVLRGKRIEGQMIRVADPSAEAPSWEVKDRFKIR